MPQRALCPTTKKQAGIMHGPYTLRRVHTAKGSRLILSGYSPNCVNKKTGEEVKITKILSGDNFGEMKACPPGQSRHLVTKRCVRGSGVSQAYLDRMVAGKSAYLRAALKEGKSHYAGKYMSGTGSRTPSSRASKSTKGSKKSVMDMLI